MTDRWIITVPSGLSSSDETLGIRVGSVRTRPWDEPGTLGKTAMQTRDHLMGALSCVGVLAEARGSNQIVVTGESVQLYGGPGSFSVERDGVAMLAQWEVDWSDIEAERAKSIHIERNPRLAEARRVLAAGGAVEVVADGEVLDTLRHCTEPSCWRLAHGGDSRCPQHRQS